MVFFVPSVCLSIRKSCQRRDCSELGTVRNWVDHCIIRHCNVQKVRKTNYYIIYENRFIVVSNVKNMLPTIFPVLVNQVHTSRFC